MSRWQYQQKAEPIDFAGNFKEETRIDKWAPTYPHRLAPILGLSAAILAGSFFFNSLTSAGAADIDKWQPRYADAIDRPKPTYLNGAYIVDPTELGKVEGTRLDKWQGKYPDTIDRARAAYPAGTYAVDPTQLTQKEATRIDKWAPTYPNRLDPAKRAFWSDSSVSDDNLFHVPGVETITVDKWTPVYPNRLDPQKVPFWQGSFSIDSKQLTFPESTRIDKWAPTYPSRLDPARRPFWTDYSVTDDNLFHIPGVEIITVDKWVPVFPARLDPRKMPFWQGTYVVDPKQLTLHEATTLDKWLPDFPNIITRPKDRIFWRDWSVTDVYLNHVPIPGTWLLMCPAANLAGSDLRYAALRGSDWTAAHLHSDKGLQTVKLYGIDDGPIVLHGSDGSVIKIKGD